MIYYQPNYKEANYIMATTDEPRAMWFVGDKAPEVKPTALLGRIEWTYAILMSMGIVKPPVIGYTSFPSMARFYRREIGRCTIGELHPGMFPLFVKPANNLKHWTGQVFKDITDLPDIGDDYVCDYSEPVEFTDEIRTFWRRVNGVWVLEGCVAYPQIDDEPDCRYAECLGDIWPDNDLPCSTLVIDIGTMAKGTLHGVQAIVEIGDMFAMGTYGADAEYLRCHKQWCAELIK